MQNNGGRLVRAEATDIVKLRVCHIENRCIVGLTVQIDIRHGRRLKRSVERVSPNLVANTKSWRLRPSAELIVFLNQVPGRRS